MEQLGSQWTDFHEILYLSTCRKSVEKIQISLKSDKNNGHYTWRPIYIYENVSDKNCCENRNIDFIASNFLFFEKSCRLWDNVEKYYGAWEATDDK